MADSPNHIYVRVRAKALIGGIEVPLVQFAVTYRLNRIPKAQLVIAQGRGMSGPGKGSVSAAHDLLQNVEPFTPVEIKVQLEAEPSGRFSPSSEDDGLKQGEEQTIFTGFMMIADQERAWSRTGLVFEAMGFPVALGGTTQFAAGLTQTWLDGSGADLVSAEWGSANVKGTLANVDAMIDNKEEDKKTVDKFVLKLFDQLSSTAASYDEKGGEVGEANESAQAALQRMTGNPLGTFDLKLEYGNVPAHYSDRALANFYSYILWGSWLNPNGGADLWQVLLKFAQEFRFSFVPTVSKDAIAPVVLGIGGEPWRSFEPSDYWHIKMKPEKFWAGFYSYISAVGITIPPKTHSFNQEKLPIGHVLGRAKVFLQQDVDGGRYVSNRLVTVPPPDYLICPPPSGVDGGRLGAFPRPDAVDPSVSAPDVDYGAIMDIWYGSDLGNSLAEYELYTKIFQHRTGQITGRFRLDIAPGSLVQIKTIGDRFVGKSETLYATAIGVTLIGGNTLETRVDLQAIRTETEHERYTTDTHPMYRNRWAGAMLVEE